MAAASSQSSVRFARRSTRGLLLGFSAPRVAVLGGAAAIAVAGFFAGGVTAFVFAALVWAPLVSSAFLRVGGRPAIEWAGTAMHFGARKLAGQTQFRARIDRPRPAGTLALPGDAAALRLYLDGVSSTAMIHDPHRETLTAALSVSHPAFVLLDDRGALASG